jgi:hypothetical protein
MSEEYPEQEKEVFMMNVYLINGKKRWVDSHKASLLQKKGQILFVEKILTEDAETVYKL